MLPNESHLSHILAQFQIEGTLISLKSNHEGHINTTLFSTFEEDGKLFKYTHQKINTFVFKDPEALMRNVCLVTGHIRSKLVDLYTDIDRRCLQVVRTRTNDVGYLDADGGYWRTYRFIDGVKTFRTIKNEKQAYLLGEAVGNFQLQLADFDGRMLFETIPHFHDMRTRYEQLEAAIQTNYENRLKLVEPELEFLLDNRERGYILSDALASGKVPLRVTHNDTKMNNVLFSEDGSEALCIIDLDTVMPGSILFDTGDMIRTATITSEEDETDLTKVTCDVKLHRALLDGYFSKATFLTSAERSLVVESGRTITQIMAVRFLTDFLNGDRYYHIDRELQSLDRTRTQVALMRDMDAKWEILTQGE